MNYLESILQADGFAIAALSDPGPVGWHPVSPEQSFQVRAFTGPVELAAVFTAVAGSIAMALADPAGPRVDPKALITFAPKQPAAPDGQLLALIDTEISQCFHEFASRLPVAVRLSEALVRDLETAHGRRPTVDPSTVANAWVKTCKAAGALIRELVNRPLLEANERKRLDQLALLLFDVENEGFPCVEADGQIVIPGWAQRRRFPRIPVDFTVQIRLGSLTHAVQAADVSRSGLGVTGCRLLLDGDRVLIGFEDGRSVPAKVVWTRAERAGLLFNEPLAADDLLLGQTPG